MYKPEHLVGVAANILRDAAAAVLLVSKTRNSPGAALQKKTERLVTADTTDD